MISGAVHFIKIAKVFATACSAYTPKRIAKEQSKTIIRSCYHRCSFPNYGSLIPRNNNLILKHHLSSIKIDILSVNLSCNFPICFNIILGSKLRYNFMYGDNFDSSSICAIISSILLHFYDDNVILSADLAVIFFKYQTSSSSINRSSNGLLILLLKVSAMWTYLSVVLILLCPISSFTILMSVPCSSR